MGAIAIILVGTIIIVVISIAVFFCMLHAKPKNERVHIRIQGRDYSFDSMKETPVEKRFLRYADKHIKEPVDVHVDFLIKAAGWDKCDYYMGKATNAILCGKYSFVMPKDDYEDALEFIKSQEEQSRVINETAENNNLGMKCEKEGDIEGAIKAYEDNLVLGSLASHSYDRLMVIYRRAHDYDNEIRVIENAIKVLGDSVEYSRRLSRAKELKAKNKSK